MERRLEDRIKQFCAKAVDKPESPELDEIIKELRAALKEQVERARKRLAAVPDRLKKRMTDL